jgi:hypothetical protein
MKRYGLFLAFLLSLTMTGCNGQAKHEKTDMVQDTINPKTDIRVNKEYDANGNLIRYDSTYSYFYSNIENDPALEDSIFRDFRSHFNQRYGFSNEPFFDEFFFEDSLLNYDFYKNDFFSNRFNRDMGSMNHLFREMDSLKNVFFYKQFPPADESDGNPETDK